MAEEPLLSSTPSEHPRIEGKQLVVPLSAVKSMQLTTSVVHEARQLQSLRLTGQLMLDPAKLVHVTTRFAGEVVSVASADGKDGPQIRIGQKVKQGQLLAKIWSKDIGEKKSDLVDALSQLYLDESIYQRLKELQKSGAIQERAIDEKQRDYESDLIQVERIRRTLTSWRISDAETQKIEAEARRIHAKAMAGPSADLDTQASEKPVADSLVDGTWGEIQIIAPVEGTILEKNITVGDIVGTADDLFKVADLSRLIVMANIYEEDLPSVMALPEHQRVWQIEVNSRARSTNVKGTIEVIGDVIDPNQHTAILQGHIDNAGGVFRIGQFMQTTIELPVESAMLQLPLEAIIDAGSQNQIFVSRSDDLTRWERINVSLSRRTSKFVWVASDEKVPLKVGDKLLTRGCLELSSLMDELTPVAEDSR